jgi:rod shape-determining protein MreD
MRRLLLSFLLLLAALVLQLTVLDRLPLPGGVAPDLVLLVVVALALSSGPMPGMITGFCAGLALDVAPPSTHLIGMYALVFCLVGYFCGLIAADLESTVLLPLAASAAGAAGGAALYAGLGILFGDPDVTGLAVRHVLPETIIYDVLLSPFVLYGVALASRLAARLTGAAAETPQGASSLAARGAGSLPAGRTPRIRAAAARSRDGWIGGGGWLAASAELARSRPTTVRLHLGGSRHSGPLRGRAANPQGAAGGKSVARLRFSTSRSRVSRRGDGAVGGLFASLSGAGRAISRPSGTSRIFTRRSKLTSAMAKLGGPAWGFRGAGGSGLGGSALRRGSFSTNAKRKAMASAATPRRGIFATAPQRKRMPATGSPRRGSFSGGSSTRGTFGVGSPRRGTFAGGPRRRRALRRVTRSSGYPLGRRSVMGRVRSRRSSTWRIGNKRNGG